MKTGIHPKYNTDCQVICTCGNKFTTGSTQKEIKVEICSACHPFFTGQMKYVDTKGRIDRFLEKMEKGKKYQKKTRLKKKSPVKTPKKPKKTKKVEKTATKKEK